MNNNVSRRQFLKFMGQSSAGIILSQGFGFFGLLSTLMSCSKGEKSAFSLVGEALLKDDLILEKGFEYKLFLSEGEKIANNIYFGTSNDFIVQRTISNTESIFMFNHESPLHESPPIEQQSQVGVSLIVCQRNSNSTWTPVIGHPLNRRIDGRSKIPFAAGIKIKNESFAVGTLANCAGGKTPWGTFLTCEENFHDFYTDPNYSSKVSNYGWEKISPYPPEHYGWVVEINPMNGDSKKLSALGRFSHEGATVTVAKNGYPVVYMGDDANDQFVYKFISSKKNSLEEGELFVANFSSGQWITLDIQKQSILSAKFSSQIDVLTNCRKAAALLGATPLDRPEDIEIHPHNTDVFVALTNNYPKGRPFGSILKIREKNSDAASLFFESETLVSGGPQSAFACPDNLCFDHKGNLWMTTDISEDKMGKGDFKVFPRNALFYIPMNGASAGKAELIALAPPDAEFTGPCFAPDNSSLFLSVQHPGSASTSEAATSFWPKGLPHKALSSVVTLSGPRFKELLQ